ncbi:MAG: hypothetical protein JOY54_06945 [Acidobacteriaceae bacterium]|nr:hypothetical protein [Acidobacteriaceae bacterium]
MTARQQRKARRAAERRTPKLENRNAATAHEAAQQTRAEINRLNAANSTGPRTLEGKDKSKRNSFKHGLYAKDLVLPGEDPAELNRLRSTLRAEHQPTSETEEILVNEIAEHFWRLRRMRQLEARGMQPENLDGWLESGLLALVARNMASAERGIHKAITTLRRLQLDRGFVPLEIAQAVNQGVGQQSVGQEVDAQECVEELHDASSQKPAVCVAGRNLTEPGFVPLIWETAPLDFDLAA